MIRLSACLFLCLSFVAKADETIPLSKYLSRANSQGHNIVFSSALVRGHYEITYSPEKPITLETILSVLKAFDLILQPVPGQGWLVKARWVAAVIEEADPPLIDTTSQIEEIIVAASLHQFMMEKISPSTFLNSADLANRPVVANDVFRAGNRLPGAANNGVSSRAGIRGGREDETLINFNGITLYEPFHLNQFNSLFSVMDGRTIDGINYVTGGFPVNYGDRLSAVIEIETVEPSDLGDQRELGLGLYTLSYLQSGGNQKQQYLFNVRRSTIELWQSLTNSDYGTPSFSDLYASYQSELDSGRALALNLLWFGDDVSINNSSRTEDADSIYGNTYLWATLDQDINEQLWAQTTLGFTAIKNDREGQVNKPGLVIGQLEDDQEFRVYLLGQEFRFDRDNAIFELGFSYRYLDAEYGFLSELAIDPAYRALSNYPRPPRQRIKLTEYGQQVAVYGTLKQGLTKQLFVEIGVRLDTQDYISSGWTKQVNPRIGLLYTFSDKSELRWSWGKFSQAQGIHELDISDGIDEFQRPQKSYHHVISYQTSLGVFDIRAEAYRKRVKDTAFYFENLTDPISLVPELQVDRTLVDPSRVTATGFELSISTRWGESDFWLNYTRASVDEKIDGNEIPRSSDQKHAANLGWSRQFRNWQVSAESSYHSGWPTARIFQDATTGDVTSTPRNSRELPHFITVDFKVSRSWQLGEQKNLRFEAGITNLLNRDNQIGSEYDVKNDLLIESDTHALPIAPFLDVFLQF